jgi:hypothetical protein
MALNKARFYSALLALSALASPALADPQLSFVAAANPVLQGSSVAVQIVISDVSDLYAYNLSLSFDASLLQVTSITEGGFLGSGGTTIFGGGDVDNAAGTISFNYGSLIGDIAGISGTGTLATIHLSAVGVGTSGLTFAPADTLFLNSQLADINVQAVNGSLQVTAVPEPSTYLLLAAGLVGIGAWRRRQAAA